MASIVDSWSSVGGGDRQDTGIVAIAAPPRFFRSGRGVQPPPLSEVMSMRVGSLLITVVATFFLLMGWSRWPRPAGAGPFG